MNNNINNAGGNSNDNLRSPETSNKNNPSPERKKVDNIIDGAGSEILQKIGVSEKTADKAVKSNGGKFSPSNSPIQKAVTNKTRDTIANGLSKLGENKQGSKPQGNNFGSKILNNMPNMGSKNQRPSDTNEQAEKMEKAIKKVTELAKKIPIPQVQAAAKAADTANKSGVTKKATQALSKNKKSKSDEQTQESSSFSTIAKLMADPVTGTLIKLLLPSIVAFLGIMMLVLFVVIADENNDLVGVGSSGQNANLGAATNPETEEMYQRILDIEQEYKSSGKNVSADKVAATYHIIARYDSSFKPKKLTDSIIREIYDGSLNGSNYDEETFKTFLSTTFFPKILNVNETSSKKLTDDVFEYLKNYSEMFKNQNTEGSTCSSAGSCTYNIKGFRINGNVYSFNQQVSNLKVRLMQTAWNNMGGTDGQPMTNEELLDFEYYVMGVNLGEIDYSYPEEAQKAFEVIVRSYSLSRPKAMNNASGTNLLQENGQWILQLRNSVADQVFCHPDKGCSRDVSTGQNSQVYSGVNNPITYKPPLPETATAIKNANASTSGQVLVDSDGNIVYLGYVDVVQKGLKSKAEAGYDYVQIALEYGASYGAVDIQKNSCNGGGGSCSSSSLSKDGYANWKQTGESWSNIQLGKSGQNIGQIGCLVTSLAIQIAKSKVNTNMNTFNPGTFVESLNKINAFSNGGGLSNYTSVSQVIPGFDYVGYKSLSGLSREQKLATIKDILNQGYYPVCEVKGNTGQHWVAIDKVEGDNIIMMDPGSSANNLWNQYNWSNTSKIVYYKTSN